MIRPLSLYIGLRYIRAKRRNGFISFISFASTVGIALGVAVLITVLSVMNGFDQQIRSHFFALTPQVTISTQEQEIADFWNSLTEKIKSVKGVNGFAPFVSSEGMLVKDNVLRSILIEGISPQYEATISKLPQQTLAGNINQLVPGSFKVMVSASTAQQMNLQVGDAVNVLTSQATTTPLGLFPRYREFVVSGIYNNTGNNSLQEPIYMAMADAQKLLAAGPHLSGLHVKLNNLYQAPQMSKQFSKIVADFTVTDWTEESGAFFHALALEKTMMFIILLLIIAIASFNLVSMLIMVVYEKRSDIAILRTLGAAPSTIRNIFIFQGTLLGLSGVIIGLSAGLALTFYINPVADGLQQLFHVQFIPGGAYGAGFVPAKILWKDIISVCAIALGLSILATLYPAWVAFRIEPAEALRYE
ncbi:MAG: lipoprotein-releasing ABC transporter permease subunit [Proteobacteria bacterium]|nr:lipoprotein-releasing ABC transporter permease subunit [Pseudomonadota bacterium]